MSTESELRAALELANLTLHEVRERLDPWTEDAPQLRTAIEELDTKCREAMSAARQALGIRTIGPNDLLGPDEVPMDPCENGLRHFSALQGHGTKPPAGAFGGAILPVEAIPTFAFDPAAVGYGEHPPSRFMEEWAKSRSVVEAQRVEGLIIGLLNSGVPLSDIRVVAKREGGTLETLVMTKDEYEKLIQG